ncbi:unnamed protein product [Strongylus vulgaris]|uniref:Uncharacterized protein n=1 Tax=Strongylus vulgaris TaxID=40348 RepID=A0A3P7JMT4_STRVU|nr:unnamed protein product [Strongylus vulgaris]
MPTGTRQSGPISSSAMVSGSSSKDAKESLGPQTPVRDVYQLRRELERIQANQLERGMLELLEKEGKRRQTDRLSTLPITSDAVARFSPQISDKGPAPPSEQAPVKYPNMFTALRAALRNSTDPQAMADTPIGNP